MARTTGLTCALALAAHLVASLPARVAHAETPGSRPDCDESCSVRRSCSSTGMMCDPDDRACMGAATNQGLEIKCESRCESATRFVYCPPNEGKSDSGYIWILLALAGTLAVGGTAVAWVALRKGAA